MALSRLLGPVLGFSPGLSLTARVQPGRFPWVDYLAKTGVEDSDVGCHALDLPTAPVVPTNSSDVGP